MKKTNIIKYSYPDYLDLINNFSNINNIVDIEYDNRMRKQCNKYNDLLKMIDKKIEELGEDNTSNENHNITKEDLLKRIDEKINKLESNQEKNKK